MGAIIVGKPGFERGLRQQTSKVSLDCVGMYALVLDQEDGWVGEIQRAASGEPLMKMAERESEVPEARRSGARDKGCGSESKKAREGAHSKRRAGGAN